MYIKSLFKKYILPHEIDFVGMLQEQSSATHNTIDDLYQCFINEDQTKCDSITEDDSKTKQIKNNNMSLLLNAFITTIDRESIYRTVTQLDWITLSVKHFVQEIKAYEVDNLHEYKEIFDLILKASKSLNKGFEFLSQGNNVKVYRHADETRELIDKISQEYIIQMVKLSKNQDFQKVFIYKEILSQLKDISKRIHVCANALQDIVVKID
jgi:uncharacterized protein Yka (UPF0111/DUF47 family)